MSLDELWQGMNGEPNAPFLASCSSPTNLRSRDTTGERGELRRIERAGHLVEIVRADEGARAASIPEAD